MRKSGNVFQPLAKYTLLPTATTRWPVTSAEIIGFPNPCCPCAAPQALRLFVDGHPMPRMLVRFARGSRRHRGSACTFDRYRTDRAHCVRFLPYGMARVYAGRACALHTSAHGPEIL